MDGRVGRNSALGHLSSLTRVPRRCCVGNSVVLLLLTSLCPFHCTSNHVALAKQFFFLLRNYSNRGEHVWNTTQKGVVCWPSVDPFPLLPFLIPICGTFLEWIQADLILGFGALGLQRVGGVGTCGLLRDWLDFVGSIDQCYICGFHST